MRIAMHEAGHAVVGVRLGFDIDYAIIGAGLTLADGLPIGGIVNFSGASWNVDTPEMWRRKVVVKLGGAAADIAADDRLNTQEEWDSALAPDRQDAAYAATQATGSKDVQVINDYVNDCFKEAWALIRESRSARVAVANHLLENFGHRVSGESLRVMVETALAETPNTAE